jgi:hypothetical protein
MTPPSRFLEEGQATLTVAKRGLMRSQASARNPDMPPRTECTVLPAIQLYRPDPVVHTNSLHHLFLAACPVSKRP